MANTKNLVKPEDMTPKERSERARKGGLQRAENDLKKKNMKEAAQALLELKVAPSQDQTREIMNAVGIDDEDMTYAMSVMVAMLMKAMSGDVNAAKFLRETSGLDMQMKAEELAKLNAPEDTGEKEEVIIYLPDNGRDNEVLNGAVKTLEPKKKKATTKKSAKKTTKEMSKTKKKTKKEEKEG